MSALVFLTLLVGIPGKRPVRSDPRAVPPYVSTLRGDAGHDVFRIAGYDGVLHPNWAGVFGIDDLRSLDALNVPTSLAWIRSRVEPLAADRFTGLESFSADLLSSAMDASNVRYLLSSAPIEDHATRLLARLSGAPLSAVGERPAVRVAPGAPLELEIAVPRCGARLDARVVPEEAAGVPAQIRVEIAAAAKERFSRLEGDRLFVDLSDFAGRAARLRVISDQSVLLSEVDPALFGDRWERVPGDGPFRLYRNREALPRAYVVSSAERAASADEALSRAASPVFDARSEVVLETDLESALPANPVTAAFSPAPILERRSGTVTVSAAGLGPGFLVLLDAFHPGWVARVDGVVTPIFRANGAFRAVPIGESARRVEFRYEPLSFHAGLALATLGLAVTLGLLVTGRPRYFATALVRDSRTSVTRIFPG
jgi:hypothetical protein